MTTEIGLDPAVYVCRSTEQYSDQHQMDHIRR